MFHYFVFISYLINKLQLSDKNIRKHSVKNVNPFMKEMESLSVFFVYCFTPYCAVQEENRDIAELCGYMCVLYKPSI